MRMMLMMMQLPVVDTLDGSSSDEQHVVVGRMEMGPEIVPRLLEDNNGTNRVLYGQKVIVDEEEDEGEEEQEGGRGGEDHGGVHQLLSRNAHKLQLLQQHGYENHHHPGQQIAATNGEEEEEDHHHHKGNDVYGVRSGQQHRQHEDEEEDEEPKLGELGSVMLRLDSGNNLGEGITGRERPPPAIDGDIGIVQQSPHHPDTSSGGGGDGGKSGRGRTSREPAIEWSEGATTVLLQAFGDKYRALDRGNFTSKIWADIAARVNAHEITSTGLDGGSVVEGPPKTREQCRIKVDNLKKRYKVEREKQRVSGCTFSKWPFFDMMEELIGSNPRLMRGGVVGRGGGMDSPGLALEIVGQPGAVRSSMQEGERMYYLEASAGGGEGDQTSQTLPKLSPILARGKRKRALKDFERRNVNAPSLMALFARYNIPGIIIEAMLQEDMDENTLINTKDIAVLIDQLQTKHRLQIKLGHAERIKQAIEDAREKKQTAG